MAVPSTINPSWRYRVKLVKAVELCPGFWAKPVDDVVISGEVLSRETIKPFVETAEPVA